MSWLVQPSLVNGPFDDPGLILDFRHGRRAILFDLGDMAALSAREIGRVTHAFVSHTHMDHFAGFDRLLRLCLQRDGPLTLVGPAGFVDQVERRVGSYTWNLVGPGSPDCRLRVHEFDGARIASAAQFSARRAFARERSDPPELAPGLVLDEGDFRVQAAALDHGIPSLAFALRERLRVNVRRGSLEPLGLSPGPWLNAAKASHLAGLPDDTPVATGDRGAIALGRLRRDVLIEAPGQVVAYVTDVAFSAENEERILALARGADQLFIEAAFLDDDRAVAAERRHLTAAQAGRLARAAGVRHMTTFHHSPRYLDRPDALRIEAEAAFRGQGVGA